jgi:polysaccharide pyruvyl transferase WcaK-like protein
MPPRNSFILAGNGPYDNRGCEAIVRGTTEIVKKYFAAPAFLAVSNFQNDDQFRAQAKNEYDHSLAHEKTFRAGRRFSPYWFFSTALRYFIPKLCAELTYRSMLPALNESKAVLSVGGDNYSLDYGKPMLFTMLDDLVLNHKKPLIIWGASVGPFAKMPDFEKYMIGHLKKVSGIFVRETLSLEYLASKGVKDNVALVADPAFLLKMAAPAAVSIEKDAIGINLSPLMANYLTDGDRIRWVKLSAQIIREIFKVTGRKVYLIPHVTSPHSNDHAFLEEVASLLAGVDFVLIEDRYNAAEIKWIIGKMAVFAGARMHSTIAAISSCVPTLSFVYSVKARGINRDIFGHEKFCILKNEYQPAFVAEKLKDLLTAGPAVREQLKAVIPELQQRAFAAGEKLLALCG